MPTIPPASGHLVLSRRPGETLHIGPWIDILILAVKFDVVRLAVMATERSSTVVAPQTTSRRVSCRLQQCVRLADAIELSLIRVRGQQARIAIKAPRDVLVLRGELQTPDCRALRRVRS